MLTDAEMSQLLMTFEECRGRHIDGKIGHRLPIRERLQYPAGLSSAAAPQLDHCDGWRKMLDDGSGMAAEESQLGTRQPIFRQQGDCFKQRRSQLIVQVHRRQFALADLAEAVAHCDGELAEAWPVTVCESIMLVLHAPKSGIDIGEVGPEPVAKRSAQQSSVCP